MNIWEKIKAGMGKIGSALGTFFAGRYGMDSLSTTLLWTGIALFFISLLSGIGIFSTLSVALYIFVVYRMLSKDKARRGAENRKFLAAVRGTRTKFSQSQVRFKNRKEYKYVRCPNCHSWIRLPRGAGSISVRCKPCDHVFDQKT